MTNRIVIGAAVIVSAIFAGCLLKDREIAKTEIMHNRAIYDLYAIEGYPNTFVSLTASDRFNGMVAKLCNSLPEGSSDLTPFQVLKLRLYYITLRLRDGIWWTLER